MRESLIPPPPSGKGPPPAGTGKGPAPGPAVAPAVHGKGPQPSKGNSFTRGWGDVTYTADGRLSVFAHGKGNAATKSVQFDDGGYGKGGALSAPQVTQEQRRNTYYESTTTGLRHSAAQALERQRTAMPDLDSVAPPIAPPTPTPPMPSSPPQQTSEEHRERSKTVELRNMSIEYPFNDLHAATRGFHKENQLGVGAYGAVFRAEMRDGSLGAVKMIDLEGLGPNEAELAGFEDEIAMLSKFRHPNLILLMGWGRHSARRFLIYEFMPGGDVQNKLLKCKPPTNKPFFARERLSVALDAATGLAYLHNATPHAYHRDIKSANILLTDNGATAKMADFGLSCVAQVTNKAASIGSFAFVEAPSTRKSVAQSMVAARNGACGTPGYICPFYMQTGRIAESAEIYSFGVVLLELLLNAYPCIVAPQQPGGLAYPMTELLRLMDKDFSESLRRAVARPDPTAHWPSEIASEVAALGLRCVDITEESQVRRPKFNDVCRSIRALLSREELQEPPMPFCSEMSAKFSQQPSWGAGSVMKRLPSSDSPKGGHDLQTDLVLDAISSHVFPAGVPQYLRSLRLQPSIDNKSGRCLVQFGRLGPAGAWLTDLLGGETSSSSSVLHASAPVYFEVAWMRTARGAPTSPNLRLVSNSLGSIVANGVLVRVGDTVALKAQDRTEIKFIGDRPGSTVGKGGSRLTLMLRFQVRVNFVHQRPIPPGFELESRNGVTGNTCCERCRCVLQ